MPYTGDPENNLVDRIRLNVGDVWPDFEMLTDADYQYFLTAAGNNVNRATMDAMRAIMFKLTRMTRERTGDIEVYGQDWFNNYYKALEAIVKDPNLTISIAMPYAGGISVSDMCKNDMNPDNFKIGMNQWKKLYDVPPLMCAPGYCGNGLYF
jgi:hypothetical protein